MSLIFCFLQALQVVPLAVIVLDGGGSSKPWMAPAQFDGFRVFRVFALT